MLRAPAEYEVLTVTPSHDGVCAKHKIMRGSRHSAGMTRCTGAFSLVELSIVLVILGLLVGGVLSGQSLIRAAELRSLSAQHQTITASIFSFRDKYFALPGDMTNATQFWGAAHATPATCRTTASTSALTCDGNGDGQIQTADGGTTFSETFRAWQHLANAGLIEGQYTGVAASGGDLFNAIPGTNVPRTRVPNGGWSFTWWQNWVGDPNAFDGPYGNIIMLGARNTAGGGSITHAPFLKGEEAWNLDTKLDDGKVAFGAIRGFKTSSSNAPNCATTSVSTTAEYNLANPAMTCALVLIPGY